MDRLFNASVRLIYEDERGQQFMASHIADRGEFWWDERKPDEYSLWNSKIRLGEDLFNEIIQHPVPLDMNILTALKRSALGLDLYLWLNYRIFALRVPLRLSWPTLYRQFGTEPDKADNRRTVDDFRKDCLREAQEDQTRLAGPALCDGQGRFDPLSLQACDCTHDRPTAPCLSSSRSVQESPKAGAGHFPAAQTAECPLRASEGRLGGLSTDRCDSGEFSTVKHPDTISVKHPDSAQIFSVKHPDTHVVKDQVVKPQVVVATNLWTKSTGNRKPKIKIKTFLIGKELKIKDLRHTAADRASGSATKTQARNPRSR